MTLLPVARPRAVEQVAAPPHTAFEDAVGIVTGAFLASLGVFLLTAGGVTTGGTAGLALLLSHTAGWSFSLSFVLVSLPFVALAVRGKGWTFTGRSAVAVALVSTFSALQPHLLGGLTVGPLYAALVGNLLAGIGILVVFRHRSSLGGFNVVALLCQERLGWRAGYVQMALDVAVVVAFAAASHDLAVSLASAAGAVLLNLVIAMNHRPGRYTGR
ncbi:MAG: YitT family protein [Ornithinibacter sp.]